LGHKFRNCGGCFLVKENSILLSNPEEQALQAKYYLEGRTKPSYPFEAEIKHITNVKEGRFN
jgi:hypothetical protein